MAEEDPGNGGGEQPPEPPVDVIYEAEDATLSAAIIDNKHPGYTGTGFVDYNPNASGGWIEWTANQLTAGEYTLEFRYASGAPEDRSPEITVNGAVTASQLSFPSTGDFTRWKTSFKAMLQAGTNVIRATATGPSGDANIDHLRIHNGSDPAGPPPVVLEEVEVTDIVGGLLLKKLEIGFHFRVAEPGWTYPDHYHKIFEILCYDGSAVQYIEGRSIAFGRGDWLVIPPGMRHHIVNSGPSDYTYLSIHLDDDLDFSPMVSNPTQ